MAPEDSGLQMWAGNQRLISGAYVDETLPLLQRAYSMDPLVGINNGMLGSAYLAAGQRELGYQHIRRAAELGWPHAMFLLILDLKWTGQDAAAALRQMYPADQSEWTGYTHNQFSVEDRVVRGVLTADGLAEIEQFVEARGAELYLAWHYKLLGDLERMFDEAQAVPEYEDMFFRMAFSPSGKSIVEHPRFIVTGEQFGLMPIWLVKGYPMGCHRVQDEIGDHLLCPSWPE